MIWFVLIMTMLQFVITIDKILSLSDKNTHDGITDIVSIFINLSIIIWGVVLITLWVAQ